MNLRLNDIKNFVATGNCRTIMQAALKLQISQPALSESLKRLETDLNVVLFYRSRTGVQLTPSGLLFLQKAQSLISQYNDLSFMKSSSQIFMGQKIRIGCHSTVAQYSLPKALRFIQKADPDFKVEIKHALSRHIQDEIQKGRIDIGIVINAVEVPDLVIQKLSADTVGVWLNKKNKSNLNTLICHTELFQTQSILKKWKNKPQNIIDSDSLELICRLTSEGLGYGIIPTKAVQLISPELQMVKSLPTYQDEISLIYRPEFGKTAAEKLVITGLKHAYL